jgi:hypothetical protein
MKMEENNSGKNLCQPWGRHQWLERRAARRVSRRDSEAGEIRIRGRSKD